jgi:uncharacterized protein YjbJ (UPF0337 family)
VELEAVCGTSMASAKHGKESAMNWDRIEGNWKQFKGHVKEQWGKLTDDQLDVTEGKWDRLTGKIQETYGSRRKRRSASYPNFSNASAT